MTESIQILSRSEYQPVTNPESENATSANTSFNIMREIKKAKSQSNTTGDFCKKIVPLVCESCKNSNLIINLCLYAQLNCRIFQVFATVMVGLASLIPIAMLTIGKIIGIFLKSIA